MKRLIVIVVLAALAVAPTHPARAMGNPDEVAVYVNDEAISTWEVGLLVPQIQNEMAALGQDPNSSELIGRSVQRAIDSLLLAQEARTFGIEPDMARVDEKMDALAEGAGGYAALEAELITSGVTFDQLKATVIQADIVRTLVETRIVPGIEISDEDVQAFYDENPDLFKRVDKIHCRHILFVVDPDADDETREAARKKAVLAHARALSGENFAALAFELSEGPNAARGGDLGFTARGQMVESFDEVVWGLEPGEISEVVESRLGFHVIKVEEFVPGEVIPLDEARQLIIQMLRQQRTGMALGNHVAELRDAAEIRTPEL